DRLQSLGVDKGSMIFLHPILDIGLPVAIQVIRECMRLFLATDITFVEMEAGHVGQLRSKRLRAFVQIDEYEAFPNLESDGTQRMILLLKTLHALIERCNLQRSIQPISPSVVGTTKPRGIS